MIKQFVLIILLSLAVIFFRTELRHILDGLIYVYNYITRMLHMIFSDDAAGRLIQNMIALLIISLLAGFIIASVFWLIKRVAMPHIMPVIYMGTLVNLANNHGSANAYDAIGEASFGKKNLVVIG